MKANKRNIVRLTENQLNGVIAESVKKALNEVDWKTYANASKKRLQQYDDSGKKDMDKYEKARELNTMAADRFREDFVGNMMYDTFGDKMRGTRSPKFDAYPNVWKKDRMPYGAVRGTNKSGDEIFSTEKGTYHSSRGLTSPKKFFRDNDVADKYEKANDELWNYDNGQYEYDNGWKLKNESKLNRIVSESIKKVLKEGGHLYGTDSEGNTFTNSDETYRGVPGTKWIWHGEWSDPEIAYKGQLINANDFENDMWDYYNEVCGDTDNDGFEKWLEEQGPDFIKDALDEHLFLMNGGSY